MGRSTTVNIIWSAMFVGVVVFQGIYFQIGKSLAPVEGAGMNTVLGTFVFAGIFCLLVVINMDFFMLSKPRTISVKAERLPTGTALKSEEEIITTAKAQWFTTRFIVALAFAEAIGALGLITGILGGSPPVVHTLFGLSYFALIYLRLRLGMSWQRMYF